MENNVVIGIEGLVGSGKTSISRELLKYIPNSILLHGGNIYRAIVYAMMNLKPDLKKMIKESKNLDVTKIMKKINLEVKLEDRETVIYIEGKKINSSDLQSQQSSLAVSAVSNVADNKNLYEFGKNLIDSYRENYNVILSSRDIVRMYPDVTYHFFITADLKERVNRKYIQYNKNIPIEQIEQTIISRDELQQKSGYYDIHNITKVIDVTDCKSVEESTEKVLKHIKIKATA
ncbi:MAG: (d)CMP kinase [Clostridia bacterium]|nr:(d)CMP kinase [Clostridia bacterium]